MGVGGLNYLAVMVAAIVSFAFGGAWYTAFSKQWLEAVGMSPDKISRDRSGLGLYLLAFAAQLVMAWMLAGVLLHLERGGLPAVRNGVISAAFLWFGFVITTMVVNYAFHGARQILTLIDGGHWLGVLLIQGGIIGVWGFR